jgi:hypothetical protein
VHDPQGLVWQALQKNNLGQREFARVIKAAIVRKPPLTLVKPELVRKRGFGRGSTNASRPSTRHPI